MEFISYRSAMAHPGHPDDDDDDADDDGGLEWQAGSPSSATRPAARVPQCVLCGFRDLALSLSLAFVCSFIRSSLVAASFRGIAGPHTKPPVGWGGEGTMSSAMLGIMYVSYARFITLFSATTFSVIPWRCINPPRWASHRHHHRTASGSAANRPQIVLPTVVVVLFVGVCCVWLRDSGFDYVPLFPFLSSHSESPTQSSLIHSAAQEFAQLDSFTE